MTRHPYTPAFGAIVRADGVHFHLWAPDARRVQLHLRGDGGRIGIVDMAPPRRSADAAPGLWHVCVEDARAGDRYAYVLDGSEPLPDPASRFQPDGVHAWSAIVDPSAFTWTDAAWPGLDPRRAVVYELHVGTFTPEGTYAAAAAKIPHLVDLGVTALELMPLADFAGARNWGYDGVALFAPSRAYGRPDDLRALIDAAHRGGLAVIVDVVYNHLGPEGAYLPRYGPRFLTDKHKTPWGGAVNLDDEGSAAVRQLLIDNARHWIHEYHADGLRLDATHSLIDSRRPHFVVELTRAVHASADPAPLVYAEDHRNLAEMIEDDSRGGWGLDGVWADDFHHVVRRMLAGDAHGYYTDYEGTGDELAATLRRGWLFVGQHSAHEDGARGTDPSHVPLRKAVVCVQNHDQVGNRALGDRLHHTADAAAWRAAVAVLLTAPMTPLLFMGQEWAASTPFQFFTDFEPGLGEQVVEGRRREFRAFPEFASPEAAARIPAPQYESTFLASRLRWEEAARDTHAPVLQLHRALLALRRNETALQASDACTCEAEALDASTVAFRRAAGERDVLVVARLRGAGAVSVRALRDRGYATLLDTEDPAFAPDSRPPVVDAANGIIHFARPGAVLLAAPDRSSRATSEPRERVHPNGAGPGALARERVRESEGPSPSDK
jgi:maltooligosyltrehalose trehalohydrolase